MSFLIKTNPRPVHFAGLGVPVFYPIVIKSLPTDHHSASGGFAI